MAKFLHGQDNTGCQQLDDIILNKVTEMTEEKQRSMTLSLFCGIGITCTKAEMEFLSTSDIRSKVEVKAKEYSNSTANILNDLLTQITFEEIQSSTEKVNNIINDCEYKITTLSRIIEDNGFSFSITCCTTYLPIKLEKNQVKCVSPWFFDQAEDTVFNIATDLICYFAKVKNICNQCLDLRQDMSESPERCLYNLRKMEADAMWIPTLESTARIMISNYKIKKSSTQAVKFLNEMKECEKETNPIFQLRELELNSPTEFAYKLVVTSGINAEKLNSYRVYWYLCNLLLPKAKIASWLKESYICMKQNIISFFNLSMMVLRGPQFKLSTTTTIAYIWIWMDSTIANHGDYCIENYVEFFNEEILKDKSIHPSTIISLVSKLKESFDEKIKGAIDFCAKNNNIDENIA